MTRQLPPAEWAEDTIQALFAERTTRGKAIYLLILLLVAVTLILLPFVRVPVSLRSPGMLRPAVEKHEIYAPVSGITSLVSIQENRYVEQGEVIITLHSRSLEARHTALEAQRADYQAQIEDLKRLLAADSLTSLSPFQLASAQYRAQLLHLLQIYSEQQLRTEQTRQELLRAEALLQRQLIPRSDWEQLRFAFEQETLAEKRLLHAARRDWEIAFSHATSELRELEASQAELRHEMELYRVLAPVSGTMEQVASISPGSFVQAGERLAVLSPDAPLVAEVLIPPHAIGLLHQDIPVRLQIDAYDYTDWGIVTGRILQISNDAVVVDQAPKFRIEIILDRHHLALPSGARGELKKGMTLQAHFVLAERSLFQLLRDDLNDWLNPSQPRGTSG